MHEEIPTGLIFTKIIFLSANVISLCQPLDQGIIRTFKAYYRRKWVRYICGEYEKNLDPLKTINVLQAIRWAMEAWMEDVSTETINNCWVKSRILSSKYGPITKSEAENQGWKFDHEYDQVARQIEDQIRDLARQQQITSAMAIEQFLNPASEMVEDDENDFINVLAEAYSTGDKAYESDEEDVVGRKISTNEAIQALQLLQLYEEQQDEGDQNFIAGVKKHAKLVNTRLTLKQTSITSYFT